MVLKANVIDVRLACVDVQANTFHVILTWYTRYQCIINVYHNYFTCTECAMTFDNSRDA